MDHGGHGGHDMPGPQCQLHMLWNTQTINTCVVFRSWHISSNSGFVLSCLIIVALGVLYEYLGVCQKKYDVHLAMTLVSKDKSGFRPSVNGRSTPDTGSEESGLLGGRQLKGAVIGAPVPLVPRIIRAVLYGTTIFLSFFLMLVFMTYNAYLIGAVVVGAAIGHYIFSPTMNVDAVLCDIRSAKTMACH